MAIQSIVRCENYNQETLDAAVARHFEALNVKELLRPGVRVLIKPNLIAPKKPEAAATTHPHLIRAVANWLRQNGVENIVLADSPGGLYTAPVLDHLYTVVGYQPLSDVLTLNRDVSFQSVSCPEDYVNRSFNLIAPLLQADLIIDMPKLKTHAMTRLSAGVKNMFGSIPGLQKPEMHYRHPDIEDFSLMLCELCRMVAPAVTLMDAIDCMEGDGPTGGNPRHLGLTLASRDVFSQDWFAATLCGMNPEDVAMLRIAKEKGWLRPDEIIQVGDEPIFADPPFVLPRTSSIDFTGFLPAFLRRPARAVMGKVLKPFPKLNKDRCVGCGKCAESCPAHIIKIENHKAVFTKKGCISCFCCQEMCPMKAISVKRHV